MQTNPRKSLLRWSEFRKGSPTIPYEVISKEPSSLPAVEIIRNQSRSGRTLKRIGDIIFSFLVLTLGSPMFILIGILVKLSSLASLYGYWPLQDPHRSLFQTLWYLPGPHIQLQQP